MSVTALDPACDARHRLDPARPHARESLVWVLAIPEEQLGGFAYTWVDAHGKAGAAGVAFGPRLDEPIFEMHDGIDVGLEMPFTDWTVGPVRVAHTEPLRTAEVSYTGDRLAIDLAFEGFHVPYTYASHADGFPSFFADDRYEQGGRARGTMRVDGDEIAVDAYCHRDHSWGARDWGAVTHYKWWNFLAQDASINVMDLQAYGHQTIRGHVHKEGVTAEIREASFSYEFDDRFVHHDLRLELLDSEGRTTIATGGSDRSQHADIVYPINPRLTLVDIIGTAEIDGAPGVTYSELSWAPEYIADRLEQRA